MVLKSELKDANKQKELVSSKFKEQNLTSNKMKANRLSSRYKITTKFGGRTEKQIRRHSF